MPACPPAVQLALARRQIQFWTSAAEPDVDAPWLGLLTHGIVTVVGET